ncbi:MAG: tRNA 2-thiouridine(34) synthase MnmA [Candidatus Latescibacteria bacterium]|nr:tRNA 2-thiouridine(34) synthase MnmA [Candidatus Latescibacterota bacterium]NIM66472.1 tRNA 2-thiouridine(34) synthase MnmA [Candidatus Latescibacterota bacterium]NIO02952.1 tRNA 2-thiouridine(34) synthase MnmA [Candidatus Latescibacterota bacterium]NIO30087.1 tRNA 2-thiouridine(34) synthase MnmA [Candidatus Latescibacterota bacterium]NIO57706.1 tRNA 2-thiouridine(34) synthase MnmA [Candidatus Latescibacterota bacterium]
MRGDYFQIEEASKDRGAVVSMSGGVDSAAAALLLRDAGFRVVGLTMKNFCFGNVDLPERSCCSREAVEDARRTCEQLGLTHRVIDVEELFTREVVDNFVAEYENARTPNPCIRCNSKVRFRTLIDHAARLGLDYAATGHYARLHRGEDGRIRIARALSASKDQSYFLSPINDRAILERVLFPLGELDKADVREIAVQRGLHVAEKDESQEVCFITGGSLKSFLSKKIPFKPGPIESVVGEVIGQHEGLGLYTIGQRRKLGIATGTPQYVVKLDPSRNALVIGDAEDLRTSHLTCTLDWMDEVVEGSGRGVSAQIRSRHRPAKVKEIERRGRLCGVVFEKPQSAICPGQTIAFYKDDVVVGSGVIDASTDD